MKKAMRRVIPVLMIMVMLMGFVPQKAEAATRLNASPVSVGVQKTVTLKVIGANSKVKWSSSNKKVATVNSKGVVKGIKKGTYKLKVKVTAAGNSNYKAGTRIITVTIKVK